jgi:hypothetical protein|tara:strand:+ start:238 stop:504 length:267 start_codon:yes stop_codon:yes gene_type:complete
MQSTKQKVRRSHRDLLLTQLPTMLEPLSGVPRMSWSETPAEAFRLSLIQKGFEEDTIMCQDCKDAVASHRGRHYDTELCADCFYERYD